MREGNNSIYQMKAVNEGIYNYLIGELERGMVSEEIRKEFMRELIDNYFGYEYTVSILVCQLIKYLSNK
jgi:hypothetical protein